MIAQKRISLILEKHFSACKKQNVVYEDFYLKIFTSSSQIFFGYI